MRRTPWLLGALLVGTTARADMMPDGYKSVQLSIAVEADVPAGKSLVLGNTFQGADVLRPGVPESITWHPANGKMQLHLIDSDKLGELERLRDSHELDAVEKTLAGGLRCGAPFQGVRTIPDTSPATEVRWHYKLEVAGRTCTANLVKTEYLDADRKVVDPAFDAQPGSPPPPRPYEPTAEDLEADDVAAPPAPAEAPKPPAPPTPGGKDARGCSIGGEHGSGAALLLVVLAALRRRRR